MKGYMAIRKLANEKKFKEAIRRAERIENKYGKSIAFCIIAELMIYENKKQEAIKLLNKTTEMAKQIKDKFTQSISISKIVVILAIIGKVEEALKLANYIKFIPERVYAMTRISHILANRGETKKAYKILDMTKKAIEEISNDSVSKIISIEYVAYSLLYIGKENEILSLIKYAESVAREMDEYNASIALSSIASIAIEAGRFDYAMKLIENIKKGYDRAWLLADIAHRKKDVDTLKKSS